LSDFFLQQIPSPAPTRLLELARSFYEQAVKARQAGNRLAADEYTGAADDLTHALENLAQAALPDNSLENRMRTSFKNGFNCSFFSH